MKKNVYIILISLFLVSCNKNKENISNEESSSSYIESTSSIEESSITSSSIEESSIISNDFDFLSLPNLSTTFSVNAALEVVKLCSSYSKTEDKTKFNQRDIQVIDQVNYSKVNDESDTCAYTIGKKVLDVGNSTRNMYVISIRGTNNKEWYSNFNFSSTKSDDDDYATNFYNCAIDVYASLEIHIEENESPLFLVTGHSRGAATANILAKLLDDNFKKENVYAYTYASPNTGKNLENSDNYSNIFNVINPCDLVCMVPFEDWGYHRFGVDKVLTGSLSDKLQVRNVVNTLVDLVPNVTSYYYDKHSLTSAGLSDDGITAYELSRMLVDAKFGNSSKLQSTFNAITIDSDYSKLLNIYSYITSSSFTTNHSLDTYKNLMKNK